MRKNSHVFNMNLPDKLKEYVRMRAEQEHTKMTQYIVDMIVKDQHEFETRNKESK